MAHNSLVELKFDSRANDSVYKVYLDLCLQVGASGVISRNSFFGGLPFEIKEFIELVEDLLLVVISLF